ncbi:MAG: hypothetical protein AAGA55_05835, partial [Planctomycetota bacterium]
MSDSRFFGSPNPARPVALAALLFAGTSASAGDPLGQPGLAGASAYEHAALLRADASAYESITQPQDGPVALQASVLLQTRYMASTRSDPAPPTDQRTTVGFDIPRAQIRLSGNLINKQLTGYLNFDFGDAEGDRGRGVSPTVPAGDGSPQLRDAYVQYNFEGSRA